MRHDGTTPRESLPRVLSFSTLYPNPAQPLHGLFVYRRLHALSKLVELQVVAPVPWVPARGWLPSRYRPFRDAPAGAIAGGVLAHHPRFFTFPKFAKTSDALMMALSCFPSVRRLVGSWNPAVIDAHWGYPDGVAAVMLARWLRLPCSVTVRGDDINIFAQEVGRRRWVRWALRRASRVIALSEDLKRSVAALGVPLERVVVIPNGVDTAMFSPRNPAAARARLSIAPEHQVMLSVGRLHQSKGFPILVDSLALLAERCPRLHLYIVGAVDPEADPTTEILDRARRGKVDARVHLVGPQSPDMLVDWYCASDVFCLASSREGSPNVVLEALACGLPCVATPVGGIPEMLSQPGIGRLVAPQAGLFADATAEALAGTYSRARIAASGRQRSWTAVALACARELEAIGRH